VLFQHRLVNHVVRAGFHMAAEVFEAKTGSTFARREETLNGERIQRFFAVFALLGGEDKYTWVKNRCTDREYESSARALASFPPLRTRLRSRRRAARAAADYAAGPSLADTFHRLLWSGHRQLLRRLPAVEDAGILRAIEKGTEIAPALQGSPVIPVHCDYHPGNLKYTDEQVVGMFDFDWAKIDYRLFDIGLGIAYFCSSLERVRLGRAVARQSGDLHAGLSGRGRPVRCSRPHVAGRAACLPRMIANANLYVLTGTSRRITRTRRRTTTSTSSTSSTT